MVTYDQQSQSTILGLVSRTQIKPSPGLRIYHEHAFQSKAKYVSRKLALSALHYVLQPPVALQLQRPPSRTVLVWALISSSLSDGRQLPRQPLCPTPDSPQEDARLFTLAPKVPLPSTKHVYLVQVSRASPQSASWLASASHRDINKMETSRTGTGWKIHLLAYHLWKREELAHGVCANSRVPWGHPRGQMDRLGLTQR